MRPTPSEPIDEDLDPEDAFGHAVLPGNVGATERWDDEDEDDVDV